MNRLRWKKDPPATGLRSVGAAPRGHVYHDGEKRYASVRPLGGGWLPMRGWYWVAGWDSDVPHYNSCNAPCETPEEAKKQAVDYIAQHLKEQP